MKETPYAGVSETNELADIILSRAAEIPDQLRIARAKSSPNLGPRILFFSGGSALNDISRSLKSYTHNSVHLITPFDSGGSSQVLRKAFNMPAVGDLRSRLMALADETELGQPDIFRLFTHRFPTDADPDTLNKEFRSIVHGQHPLMQAVSQPMRSLILTQIKAFDARRPKDFDLRNASVGNLIVAGGYFANDFNLEPVLFIMSKMVAVLGTVRAIVDDNLHIGAKLENGSVILGQRELTGKEVPPLPCPIQQLFLTNAHNRLPREAVRLPMRNRRLIRKSDVICYAPGSLFSSVIANLLPLGVGATIAERHVPKVYLPSLGTDPECPGMDLADQLEAILSALKIDAPEHVANPALVSTILCDETLYTPQIAKRLSRLGVQCVPTLLHKAENPHQYDPNKVCDALISLS